MPMYEYQCEHGHVTDIVSRMGTRPETIECRACGCEAKRIVSQPLRPIVKSGTKLHHGTRGVK